MNPILSEDGPSVDRMIKPNLHRRHSKELLPGSRVTIVHMPRSQKYEWEREKDDTVAIADPNGKHFLVGEHERAYFDKPWRAPNLREFLVGYVEGSEDWRHPDPKPLLTWKGERPACVIPWREGLTRADYHPGVPTFSKHEAEAQLGRKRKRRQNGVIEPKKLSYWNKRTWRKTQKGKPVLGSRGHTSILYAVTRVPSEAV